MPGLWDWCIRLSISCGRLDALELEVEEAESRWG